MSKRRLTFKEITDINIQRTKEWHNGDLGHWSIADWSNAMAGEAGEVCNAVKKLRRIETGLSQASGVTKEDMIKEIAKEIGDTYLYLNILAERLNLDIQDCIVNTFNRVSDRENLNYFIDDTEDGAKIKQRFIDIDVKDIEILKSIQMNSFNAFYDVLHPLWKQAFINLSNAADYLALMTERITEKDCELEDKNNISNNKDHFALMTEELK